MELRAGWNSGPDRTPAGWNSGRLLLRLGEDHDPDLGHVLDRPPKPLAAQPGILDTAVRHVIDPIGRDVVDDYAADLELGEGAPRVGQVVGEDPGLEPEHRVVDPGDRRAEVAERE